jgi:hypothetical protein
VLTFADKRISPGTARFRGLLIFRSDRSLLLGAKGNFINPEVERSDTAGLIVLNQPHPRITAGNPATPTKE